LDSCEKSFETLRTSALGRFRGGRESLEENPNIRKNRPKKVEKDEKFFEKKVLTLVWVFGTIIKRATETRQRKEH